MYSKLALAMLAGTAWAIPAPQGVNSAIAPSGSPLCSADFSGTFEISAVTTSSMKRDIEKRACGTPGALVISLSNGVLTDSQGRTGYIAANYQYQFDKPPQAGALYTAGFSACSNGSLALGDSAVFYQCLSGNFYNLYDRDWAPQCKPILLQMLPCSGGGDPVVTQISDGQPQAASATPITQLSDGQPQGGTAPPATVAPVTQISDGQVQAPTSTGGAVVTQISDGQIQAPTSTGGGAVITQISDGQVQAPTSTPAGGVITQISDGQVQAPTTQPGGPVITQISDGQVQAPTSTGGGAVVTQISDGQVQAPTSTGGGAVVTQISDGQVQAPTTTVEATTATPTGAVVTQISDGQVQAPTGAPTGTGSAPTVTPPAGNFTTGVPPQPTPSEVGANAGSTFSASSSLIAVALGALAVMFL
jgi:hypothetical protein